MLLRAPTASEYSTRRERFGTLSAETAGVCRRPGPHRPVGLSCAYETELWISTEGLQNTDKVREDFDRLAGLSEESWDHNVHYHDFLLGHLPESCGAALEVGCGTGAFARALSERAGRVTAIDLSPRMVEIARARSDGHPNIEYVVADASSWEFPAERFDCAASIATVHHLPLEPILGEMRDALKPGGTLLLLDLYRARSPADYLVGALGFPASLALGRMKSDGRGAAPELRQAWEEHGRSDIYPTLKEVRRACDAVLPGAEVRRRLLWRYSVIWRKPIP